MVTVPVATQPLLSKTLKEKLPDTAPGFGVKV